MVLAYSPTRKDIVVLVGVAAEVWRALDDSRSGEQLVAAVNGLGDITSATEGVDPSPGVSSADVEQVLRGLEEAGLVHT